MPTVTISRAETGFSNRNARFKLIVDGEKAGVISKNQRVSLDVTAGRHTLAAKINWVTSEQTEFTIDEGQELCFHLRLNRYGDLMLLLRPSKYVEIIPA